MTGMWESSWELMCKFEHCVIGRVLGSITYVLSQCIFSGSASGACGREASTGSNRVRNFNS